MAQREKTFKKPSYRVNKRILERYIRSKYDLLGLTPILFPVRSLIFGKELEATALPILIDSLFDS
jgi:hypothetical protein